MQTVSPVRHVWSSFKFRHDDNISAKQCITVVDAWGVCGARERCLELRYRGIWRNTYSTSTNRELRLYWISLEPCARHTCEDVPEANSLLYRTGAHILPLPCATSNVPSHMSILQVSGRTPLELGGNGQRCDASTFECERHRACSSVKPSIDQPSHVPLHAHTLRGAALSS